MVLFVIIILLHAVSLSCLAYTCASVAIAVPVLVAAVDLDGTNGDVLNVLVHPIV